MLAMAHVSKAIMLVHTYVKQLLEIVCPDEDIRGRLWNHLLREKLVYGYKRAIAHTELLIKMNEARPLSYNPQYHASFYENQAQSLGTQHIKMPHERNSKTSLYDRLYYLLTGYEGHKKRACSEAQIITETYYNVARATFVDNVCRQSVIWFLLEGPDSPLNVFSGDLVTGLSDETLELIAGEDQDVRQSREVLLGEIREFERARDILRM